MMMLLVLLLLPVLAGGAMWLFKKNNPVSLITAIVLSGVNLYAAIMIYKNGFACEIPVSAVGFVFSFRADSVSQMFILLAGAIFPLLSIYTASFCRDKDWGGQYQFWLYTSLAMINGAFLSDHLGVMLFFWEGLLCTLFGMLLIRNRENPRAAMKALTVSGIADLLLMLGIVATIKAAGTGIISQLHGIPIEGIGTLGCACLMLGALGKAGCMPFHSWIPVAAEDAPTPFLAAFPGSMEKLVGIYLASRIVTQIYDFAPGGTMSTAITVLGAVTLFGGVAMALIQKDMKKLCAFHAVSQVGYIVVGLGTGLAVGVSGGVFHMLNNALYKAGLFMAAGSIEKMAGTTDLHKISGLRKKMPITFVSTMIFALSIAGFPMTNGFWSKEMIFDAALETNTVYYIIALAGAFMTAVSFLKLTHAAFFGKFEAPESDVHEAPVTMTMPAVILAGACLVCGLWNVLPLDIIIGRAYGFEESFSGAPKSWPMVIISCVVLTLAVLDHIYGCKKTGVALKAADHLHEIPGVKQLYAQAEKGTFDPYNWISGIMNGFAAVCQQVENAVTWIYDKGVPGAVKGIGSALSKFDNGHLSRYLALTVAGAAILGIVFFISLM